MKTRATKLALVTLVAGAAALCGCKAMETSKGGTSSGDPKLLTARSPGWTGRDGPTGQGMDPMKELPGGAKAK